MSRRAKNRVPRSLTLDRKLDDALSECKNASDVVNEILMENIGRIGDATEEDQLRAMRKRLKRTLKVLLTEEIGNIIESELDRIIPEEVDEDDNKEDDEED
jgi:hypothetical protein